MTVLRSLLALLLVLVPLSAQAQSQPNFPKLTGQVVDAANLLSPEQAAQITQLSAEVQKASTRQFVVVTVPDLQGYDIADYGYQLGRAWGIGQKDANNGILLIVAPNERKVRIEVGYGLEPIMTDAMSGQIIQGTIIPRFKANDMAGGIVAGAQAIAEQMKLPLEAAEQRAQQAQVKVSETARRHRQGGNGISFSLIFWSIVLIFVIVPLFRRGLGKRRGPWDRRYRSGDGGALPIILWSIANEIGREASRGGSSSWGGGGGGWGGGGGGWGGGGGGGGGFSGGGGSFGGGGASGSW